MPSASAAWAMPSIACASSYAIAGFSGLPKLRQSVRPSGSPPAQATLRAAPSTACTPAAKGSGSSGRGPWGGAAGAGAGGPRAVGGAGAPPPRRPQPQNSGVEARAADGARSDELVVLLEDPPLALAVGGREGLRLRRPGIGLRLL